MLNRERAGGDSRDARSGNGDHTRPRPRLSGREVLNLIFRTYAVSLPYVLIFIAVMLIATWLVTEVLFR